MKYMPRATQRSATNNDQTVSFREENKQKKQGRGDDYQGVLMLLGSRLLVQGCQMSRKLSIVRFPGDIQNDEDQVEPGEELRRKL